MSDALQIAKYVLENAKHSISGKKLQKLVYYCEAWHITALDKALFTETPQAWTYGPVFQSIWRELGYTWPVSARAHLLNVTSPVLDDDSKAVIDSVLAFYGGWSESELIDVSHEERPWKKAYKPGQNRHILNEDMRSYYSGKLARGEACPDLPVMTFNYVLEEDMAAIEASLDDDQPAPGLVSMLTKVRSSQ